MLNLWKDEIFERNLIMDFKFSFTNKKIVNPGIIFSHLPMLECIKKIRTIKTPEQYEKVYTEHCSCIAILYKY